MAWEATSAATAAICEASTTVQSLMSIYGLVDTNLSYGWGSKPLQPHARLELWPAFEPVGDAAAVAALAQFAQWPRAGQFRQGRQASTSAGKSR